MTGTEKGRPATGALVTIAPFAALYTANAVPEGFILGTVLLGILNLEKDASTLAGAIFASAIALPWALKPFWVWALRADVLAHGRAKKIFEVTTVGMGATVVLVPFAAMLGALPGVAVMLFAHNVLRSLQDVVTDGLAVRTFQGKEQTTAQAVMRIAGTFGKLAGGAGMLWLQGKPFEFPLWLICAITGALIVASGLLGAFLLGKEKGVETQSAESVPTSISLWALLRALWKATPVAVLAVALLANIGAGFVGPLTAGRMLKVVGYTQETAAPLDALFWTGALVGAFAGLFLGRLMSQRKLLALGVVLTAMAHIAVGTLGGEWGTPFWMKAIVMMLAFASGVYGVGLCSLLASYTSRRFAATHFAIFMSCLNLSSLIGKGTGGATGNLDLVLGWQFVYPAMFFVAGVLALLVLLPLLRLKPPKVEE